MTPMPNAPRTPLKSFRIPEDLYREAQQLAADEGQSVSDVVRKARWSDTSKPAAGSALSVGTCNQPHGTTHLVGQTRGGDSRRRGAFSHATSLY